MSSHLITVDGDALCGGDPNGDVVLPVADVANPDVLDAVEVCSDCLTALLAGAQA